MRGRQKPIAISSFSSLLIPYSCRNKITDTLSPGSLPRPYIKGHFSPQHHWLSKDKKRNVTQHFSPFFPPRIAGGNRGLRLPRTPVMPGHDYQHPSTAERCKDHERISDLMTCKLTPCASMSIKATTAIGKDKSCSATLKTARLLITSNTEKV